tara:strand:- start:36 stop:662 length:627 start_codon:yes stop_codon:yes gene_type:complete
MEDVLEVYERPPDEQAPLVCFDEFCKQLLDEERCSLPCRPGVERKQDSEYIRKGSISGFMIALPHLGRREVFVSESGRRTGRDFAKALRYLAEELLTESPRIILVMDNLNTHHLHWLYEVYPPEQAAQIARRFEIHYTPKHGSWLNMAEIEIGLLVRHGLKERIGCAEDFRKEVQAYVVRKNTNPTPINWQFTDKEARIKLQHLYPSI